MAATARLLVILASAAAVGFDGSNGVAIESNAVVLLRGHDEDLAVQQIDADGDRRVWRMQLPRVPTAIAAGDDLVAVAVAGPPL